MYDKQHHHTHINVIPQLGYQVVKRLQIDIIIIITISIIKYSVSGEVV